MWAVLRVGVHTQPGGMAQRLLEEQIRSKHNFWAQKERAALELEMERRNIVSAMRHREPERGGLGLCNPPASLLSPKSWLICLQRGPCDQSIS